MASASTELAASRSSSSQDHHHDHEEHIHLPEPSLWPFILVVGISFLPIGFLMAVYGGQLTGVILGAGILVTVIGSLGWATSVIREKPTIDQQWGNRSLSLAWKLFLLSEAAIFGAFFGHLLYTMYHATSWPPPGTPSVNLAIPAIGTFVLVFSSVTCELAHKALLAGKRAICKNWLFLTMGLGLAFLGLQSFEWAYLIASYDFLPTSGYGGTIFYLITGFHGFHVITGLLLLMMVYARLETGSFDRKRHFSMNAASWYWHFVDVIWVFVFFILYAIMMA